MIKIREAITAFVVLMLSFGAAANAKDVNVGATSINFIAPKGFCELEDSSAPVDGTRKLLAPRNKLLAYYADCKSNMSLPLDNFAHYSAMTDAINETLPADSIGKICGSLRQNGQDGVKTVLQNRAADIGKFFEGLKINEARFMGVVAEESSACYIAIVVKLLTGAGAEKVLVSISASINIKGKLIGYSLYSPYINSGTVGMILEKHRANVAAFFVANRS